MGEVLGVDSLIDRIKTSSRYPIGTDREMVFDFLIVVWGVFFLLLFFVLRAFVLHTSIPLAQVRGRPWRVPPAWL